VVRPLLVSALVGYLLGSIPTSYIAGRVSRGIDLKQHGSGNLGATNAFRVLGWKAALPVLVVDVGKGALAVLLGATVLPSGPTHDFSALAAAIFVVLGHMTSPWVGFKGGKGVAPAAGAFLTLAPWGAVPATGVWLFLLLVTRVMSLASIAAAAVFPVCLLIHELSRFGRPSHWATLIASFAVAFLVVLRHRGNIQRLRQGTEKPLWH
jgi:glycerol-3-phosphate acyltransferase PlsY